MSGSTKEFVERSCTPAANAIKWLVLPTSILLTPFLVFLEYNSYPLARPETSFALAGLVALGLSCSVVVLRANAVMRAVVVAALIVIFIDVQFAPRDLATWIAEWIALLFFSGIQTFVLCVFLKDKFYTLLALVFSTFLAVTACKLLVSANETEALLTFDTAPLQAHPRIIHLLLDEHIGVEGIPTDIAGGTAVKEVITDFYRKNGFQLFGGAFSRYFETEISVGRMMNFTPANEGAAFIRGQGPYALLRNDYFASLGSKKYRLTVVSPGWLDFCSNSTNVANCVTRDWSRLRLLGSLDLPVRQKIQVLFFRYINRSTMVSVIINALNSFFQSEFPSLTPFLDRWTWAADFQRTRMDSLNALTDFQLLENSVSFLRPGTALFAHLLVPHFPYVVHADCSIRTPDQDFLWKTRGFLNHPPVNTPASRKVRYQEYFEQLHCLYRHLDNLVKQMRRANIYDESIILIHGDHGSRIVLNDATPKNRAALTQQDIIDGFSTLFAMKLPGKLGFYDTSPRPLEELFARFVVEAGLTKLDMQRPKADAYIYLTTRTSEQSIRIPYPAKQ